MGRRLAVALVCIMAVTCAVLAEVAPSELTGRWNLVPRIGATDCNGVDCRLTYDLAPCGEVWCGVEVKDDQSCGRVAFRLNPGSAKNSRVEFFGSYQRTEATAAYKVRASLYYRPGQESPARQLLLSVFGSTDGDFQPFRRSYPLQMLLSRSGDALCRAQPKVS
jgi:hypothetical protein